MSTEIEFAFVGRDVRQFLPRGSGIDPPYFDADENTRPWDDRQRVTLTVGDNERLVSIFDRAIEAAGVFEADWSKHQGRTEYGTWRHIALRDDGSPIPLVYRLTGRPVLVDDDGHALWGRGLYGETTYAQLRASAEAGAVPGDPTQIYLNVRLGPAGGEAFIEWELVIQAWDIAWKVAATLAAASGAHDLYVKVRDRLDGYRVVERKAQEWLKRNGWPDLVRETLSGEPWSPRDFAGLHGCTVNEAEKILALYGYERESSQRWVYAGGYDKLGFPSTDLSARVVTAYINEARFDYPEDTPERNEALFTVIIEQAIEKGEVTGLRYEEYFREGRNLGPAGSMTGTILVRPVLFCAPVFWTPAFWSDSTHSWDWVRPETPLDEKPSADLEVSLDVTLGEVLEAACDAWRIDLGSEALEHGGVRANNFERFAFVRPEDADGVDEQEGYRWPARLHIAREDGTVELVHGREITFRELLASSTLGLIEGDVTRPYVHPVIPQGDVGHAAEAARLTIEAIRAAYGAVDDATGFAEHTIRLVRASLPEVHKAAASAVDEGMRIGAIYVFGRWVRRQLRRWRSRDD